jgi:hypothetical protein
MDLNEKIAELWKKSLFKLIRGGKTIQLNLPNPDCPTQCIDAKKATYTMPNLDKDIDPTRYFVVCINCGGLWAIVKKKDEEE